jgi:hypothetical protein
MITKDLTYNELLTNSKKGLRNGNWRKQRLLDKALYRAAMGYARYGRSTVNGMLVEKLLGLIERLKETKTRIMYSGWRRCGKRRYNVR